MNEVVEKKVIASPCVSKIARTFNNMATYNPIQGMKKVVYLDRQIAEAELAKQEALENPVIEEVPIPTGTEIRQDREEGEYR